MFSKHHVFWGGKEKKGKEQKEVVNIKVEILIPQVLVLFYFKLLHFKEHIQDDYDEFIVGWVAGKGRYLDFGPPLPL